MSIEMMQQERWELTAKARVLNSQITSHPYLSGLMTERMRGLLIELIRKGDLLDEISTYELTRNPSQEEIDAAL